MHLQLARSCWRGVCFICYACTHDFVHLWFFFCYILLSVKLIPAIICRHVVGLELMNNDTGASRRGIKVGAKWKNHLILSAKETNHHLPMVVPLACWHSKALLTAHIFHGENRKSATSFQSLPSMDVWQLYWCRAQVLETFYNFVVDLTTLYPNSF